MRLSCPPSDTNPHGPSSCPCRGQGRSRGRRERPSNGPSSRRSWGRRRGSPAGLRAGGCLYTRKTPRCGAAITLSRWRHGFESRWGCAPSLAQLRALAAELGACLPAGVRLARSDVGPDRPPRWPRRASPPCHAAVARRRAGIREQVELPPGRGRRLIGLPKAARNVRTPSSAHRSMSVGNARRGSGWALTAAADRASGCW